MTEEERMKKGWLNAHGVVRLNVDEPEVLDNEIMRLRRERQLVARVMLPSKAEAKAVDKLDEKGDYLGLLRHLRHAGGKRNGQFLVLPQFSINVDQHFDLNAAKRDFCEGKDQPRIGIFSAWNFGRGYGYNNGGDFQCMLTDDLRSVAFHFIASYFPVVTACSWNNVSFAELHKAWEALDNSAKDEFVELAITDFQKVPEVPGGWGFAFVAGKPVYKTPYYTPLGYFPKPGRGRTPYDWDRIWTGNVIHQDNDAGIVVDAPLSDISWIYNPQTGALGSVSLFSTPADVRAAQPPAARSPQYIRFDNCALSDSSEMPKALPLAGVMSKYFDRKFWAVGKAHVVKPNEMNFVHRTWYTF